VLVEELRQVQHRTRHVRGLAAVIALATATAILATITPLGFAVGCGLALGKHWNVY